MCREDEKMLSRVMDLELCREESPVISMKQSLGSGVDYIMLLR